MKNKKGLVALGAAILAGLGIVGGVCLNKKGKAEAEAETTSETVEDNESNVEE